MRAVKRFPTSYRWIITNNMLQLAGDIYVNCIKANSIYPHEKMRDEDFELRHRYLLLAISGTEALLAEISFCYALIDDGTNFFKGRADYERVFSAWAEAGNTTLARLRALEKSDRQRQAGWKKKAAAQAAADETGYKADGAGET